MVALPGHRTVQHPAVVKTHDQMLAPYRGDGTVAVEADPASHRGEVLVVLAALPEKDGVASLHAPAVHLEAGAISIVEEGAVRRLPLHPQRDAFLRRTLIEPPQMPSALALLAPGPKLDSLEAFARARGQLQREEVPIAWKVLRRGANTRVLVELSDLLLAQGEAVPQANVCDAAVEVPSLLACPAARADEVVLSCYYARLTAAMGYLGHLAVLVEPLAVALNGDHDMHPGTQLPDTAGREGVHAAGGVIRRRGVHLHSEACRCGR
mmetsp:Transcript_59695/g.129581  ORF Transcript_59695/g.129581 Transcript_59695/m.129581 type:complete len:266 (-) Transcript_59695:405-1202(-)